MELINLTPHPVTIHGVEGSVTLPKGVGALPRLAVTRREVGAVLVGGVVLPISRVTLGEVTDLPDPREGVMLLVSAMVAEACPTRADLVSPGELVRDMAGVITGANGLSIPR